MVLIHLMILTSSTIYCSSFLILVPSSGVLLFLQLKHKEMFNGKYPFLTIQYSRFDVRHFDFVLVLFSISNLSQVGLGQRALNRLVACEHSLPIIVALHSKFDFYFQKMPSLRAFCDKSKNLITSKMSITENQNDK